MEEKVGKKIMTFTRIVAWIMFALWAAIGIIGASVIGTYLGNMGGVGAGTAVLWLAICFINGGLILVLSWWSYGYGLIVQDMHNTALRLGRIESALTSGGTAPGGFGAGPATAQAAGAASAAAQSPKYCPSCSAPLKPNAKFCPSCGKHLS